MKTIGVREAKQHLSNWIREAQRQSVLVVSHGRPAAVLIGVEGVDVEDTVLAELHRRRMSRGSTSISGDELSKRLGLDPRQEAALRRSASRNLRKRGRKK